MAELILDWQGWDGEFYTVKSTAVGQPPWEDYNQDGVRDREHDLDKPPGVARVVVLGDSTTFGFWLPPREAFPQVLQDLLDARGQRFEVFNVALPGWTTRQELIAYRRIARKYQPDRVLLAICLNDIPEMQNNLTRPPAFVMSLFKRSALVRRAVLSRDREIQDEMEMLHKMDSPKVQQGFALMFGDLRTLRREVEADGGQLGLLILPFRFQFRADAPPPLVQERVLAFCKAEGIPCLDLLPALRPLGQAAFHDFDHFTAEGSRLVADAVLRSGLVSTGAPLLPLPTPRLEPVMAALLGTDARARAEAAWAAGRLEAGSPELRASLVRSLRATDPRERAGAAWSLGRLRSSSADVLSGLVACLDDPDDGVRWRAVSALGHIGADREVEVDSLLPILAEPQGRGRAQAAEILGRLGPAAAPAVAGLAAAAGDSRDAVRWRAVWALGEIGPAAAPAVPALVAALADPDLRWRAADALGRIGPGAAPAVTALVAHLEDASSSVRWRVVQALGSIGKAAPDAAAAVARRTTESDTTVRLAALSSLEEIGDAPEALIAVYRRALGDEDWRVRTQASNALGRLGPVAHPAVSDLLRALHDVNPSVRSKAARALGRIEPEGREVGEALARAASDSDERVHEAAAKALTRHAPRAAASP
jgi:HEAT repeat protein/lysophospholipase L1-like esterase